MSNNYPSLKSDVSNLDIGDIFFVERDPEGHNPFCGMVCKCISNEDLDEVPKRSFEPIVRYTKSSRASSNCALLNWFSKECERHSLPIPSYYFNIGSFSLWTELGHHGQKYNLPDVSWRDKIFMMPYKEQVKKVYKGLLYESLGKNLLLHDIPSSICLSSDESFEDLFVVGDISLSDL